ncbi:hypothetical protein M407DRAFT_242278 [Tulasnella calospora MUT 4182]|uniref:Uncharacterized protein n=1 Tax=Tulasnella calospora MUT 4182 TaxID=1051891 RepID=A0A0C3M945_9AGAM|nr:hypothetical protein M407DRAFT_242278 [Tulasnella calospora MUT 4182]
MAHFVREFRGLTTRISPSNKADPDRPVAELISFANYSIKHARGHAPGLNDQENAKRYLGALVLNSRE